MSLIRARRRDNFRLSLRDEVSSSENARTPHACVEFAVLKSALDVIAELDRARWGAHRRSEIFLDWLDMVDASLRMLPWHVLSVMQSGTLAEDDDVTQALWSRLREKYQPAQFKHLARAFGVLLDTTEDEHGAPTYRDVLGEIYMDMAMNPGSGQFFTPWEVACLMAELQSDHGALVRERHAVDDFTPVTVNDPACGSGVLLLAFASTYPVEMVRQGHVMFYGQDIDATCVKMAHCNMRLYGMNRSGFPLHVQRSIKRTPVRRMPVPFSGGLKNGTRKRET